MEYHNIKELFWDNIIKTCDDNNNISLPHLYSTDFDLRLNKNSIESLMEDNGIVDVDFDLRLDEKSIESLMEGYGIVDVGFNPGIDEDSIELLYKDYGIQELKCDDIFDEDVLMIPPTIDVDPNMDLVDHLKEVNESMKKKILWILLLISKILTITSLYYYSQ